MPSTPPGSPLGEPPRASSGEVDRIRAVYRERDRSRPRARPIGEAYRRLNAQRLAAMRTLLDGLFPGQSLRLIDVGCGGGYDLSRWLAAGWPADRLAGVDVVPTRLDAARAACPGVDLRLSSDGTIPHPDASFDVATAVTVFSSILDPTMRRTLFAEMRRVVRPGGVVVVYDFVVRKPTNPNVLAMDRRRLEELGAPPTGSKRLSPLLQLVAAGAAVHPRLADLAMRITPPTHRLTYWRIG